MPKHHRRMSESLAHSVEPSEAQRLKAILLLVVPFALALVACSDGAPDSRAGTLVERSAAMTPYRFAMVSSDPIEHGERLSAVLGCIGCHTTDLTGEDWSDPDLGVLWTANLTHSAADYSADDLTVMITDGKRPDRALMDMPSYLFAEMHADDLAALVGYLKSLPVKGDKHPEPTIGPELAEAIASGEFKDSVQSVAEMQSKAPPDLGPEHAFARSILRATCAECHGMNLEGSAEQMSGAPPRPSLRMVAAYSMEDFSTLMKTGKPIGGRELQVMGGVSRGRYSRFTDGEIQAVYDYLMELSRRAP